MRNPISPYRTAPVVARFVCIACYRSLSSTPGSCPHCHVDRLDLARPEVRDEVLQEAERRLYRRMMREEMTLGGIAGGSGIVLGFVLFLVFHDWVDESDVNGRVLFAIAFAVGFIVRAVLLRLYIRLRPDAGIATYAARRRRLSRELGHEVQLQTHVDDIALPLRSEQPHSRAVNEPLPNTAESMDSQVADLNQILRSLGATLDN